MARNKYDIDENLQTEFNFSQLKRLGTYIRPYRKDLIFTIFLLVFSSALTMLQPIILMIIIDDYIPDKNISGIIIISLLLLAMTLITCVIIRVKTNPDFETGAEYHPYNQE